MSPFRSNPIPIPPLRTGADITGNAARCGLCAVLLMLLSGCVQEMANQPRVDVMEPTGFERYSAQYRLPPEGTIARGQNGPVTPVTSGREGEELVATIPVPVDLALLERGQKQYSIFCRHCHGDSGSGDGLVVQRGFPAPPTYHSDRLRDVADGRIFEVISNGMGRMPTFGGRIKPQDRWAIVAYVRALQTSQNFPAQELSDSDRKQLVTSDTHDEPSADHP